MSASFRTSLVFAAGLAGSLLAAPAAVAQPATPATTTARPVTAAPPAPAPAPARPVAAVEPAEAAPPTTPVEPPVAADPAAGPAIAPVAEEPVPTAPPAIDPALIAAAVEAELETRDGLTWKDGFTFRSGDGAFELKIGGYTHFDGRFFLVDEDDKLADQFTFRRIRPELRGTLFERAEFRLLPDFANNQATVQDAYVDLTVAGKGQLKIRAGKFKEPFGIERLQSATAIVFVERALPTQLVPNRDLGLQLHGDVAEKRVHWAVGVFNGVADGGSTVGDNADDKEVAARLFATPFAPRKGTALEQLGVGAAVTYGRKSGSATATDLPQLKTSGQFTFFSYRTAPAGGPEDANVLADGTHWRASAQGHWYSGPLGVLAEYVHSDQEVVLGPLRQTVGSDAWQLALSGVIGGKTSFKSVTLDKPFDPGKGQWGAFELAARYHELRIGDEAFEAVADASKSARQARSFGGGVSWHLSKALKSVLDFETTAFQGGAADGGDRPAEHAVLGRVQTVF